MFYSKVTAHPHSCMHAVLLCEQVQLMDLDSLPPVAMETPSAEQERVMAREVFEHAVILAIKSSDKEAFQRFLGSLRPYYTGFGPAVSESAFKSPIAGLHLLFLLVENQLAEFHSEVRCAVLCCAVLFYLCYPSDA
jgi:26S proteasome regulatory subunit N12